MFEFFGQLVLATILGAFVGLERELSKKAAGMRTFALVSLGAAFFTIISIMASEEFSNAKYLFDVSRIPSQIVLGVGFIGAGLIIFHRSQLRGLTTAAGLWVAAAIGMAVGFRIYLLAVFTTFLVVLIFVAFWFIESRLVKKLASKPPKDTQEL
jgi:putative Mg2+ transporter-C (MgtC) family protein